MTRKKGIEPTFLALTSEQKAFLVNDLLQDLERKKLGKETLNLDEFPTWSKTCDFDLSETELTIIFQILKKLKAVQ